MHNNFTYEEALSEPDEYFKTPDDILINDKYSKEQKIKLLEQWKNDIKELLTAEEENMPKKTKNGRDLGELMEKINHILEDLE